MSMQVVVRALSVLTLLSHRSDGLLLREISEGLSLPPATCHRLLGVLEEQAFITRSSSSRKYFLGPAARELAGVDQQRATAFASRHPAVERASRETGETVFVCESIGDDVVCTTLAESSYPLRLFVRVGQRMPLHAAASARVLLAWRPEEQVLRALSDATLTPFTPGTPETVPQVMERLAAIRERGYDVCESELDENVWAVAAPIRAAGGEVVASVTLSAPVQRMAGDAERDEALRVVRSCAEAMSADLGWALAAAG